MRKHTFSVLAVLILGSFGIAAIAQQPDYQPPADQQPSVNVQPQPGVQQPGNPPQSDSDQGAARVSFIRGDVSMQRGDTGETFAVTLNTPLMAGDKISAGDASRAEVQLDFANVLRLDEHTQVNIVALSRSRIQLQIAQGLASYSAVRPSEADVEIDTPNVSIHPQRQGRYRIQINDNGDTQVLVRDGQADVSTEQGSTQVHRGEMITIQGSADQAQYRVTAAPANNDWDNWNDGRDHSISDAQGYQHTNPYYTGSQDLNPYGVWSEVPDYGPVWTPTVDAGWAPYRAGRWVYEPYWGWTWVSYEPWGWAPYHYGRWFLNGSQWAWWPGPVYGGYRPLWAPAYVSFFGYGGGGFGFGFGFGNVGWLAIGPGDFFHPWWGGFRGGYNVVDIHNYYNVRGGFAPLHNGGFSNFRDIDRNDRLRAGMSSMSSRGFGTGAEPVRGGVSAENLRGARGVTGGMPISPSRASMRVSDRPGNSQVFSAHSNQRFFSGTPGGTRGFQGQTGGGFNRGPAGAPVGGFNRGPASTPQQQSGGWQRFSGGQSRGESGNQGTAGNLRGSQPSYRPPLSMNRPIVNENQRANGPSNGANGGNRGGYPVMPSYRGAPSGNAPSENRSFDGGGYRGGAAPTYRGEPAPAPSYRSAPSPAPGYRGAPEPNYRGGPAPSYRSSPAPSYHSAPAPSYRAPAPSGGSGGSSRGGGGGGGGTRGNSGGSGSRGNSGGGGGGSGNGHRH
jgi:hypothetical protein